MTTRFVGPITAALACTIFVAACGSSSTPPSKACIEAARLYAEAIADDTSTPEGEKADKLRFPPWLRVWWRKAHPDAETFSLNGGSRSMEEARPLYKDACGVGLIHKPQHG